MKNYHFRECLVSGAMMLACSVSYAQNFIPIKNPDCTTPVFTVGGQYLDANNGVVPDAWSMLMRWQGSDMANASPGYNLGQHTNFNLYGFDTISYQRGRGAWNGYGFDGPGTQGSCYDAGMYIDTWHTPHVNIIGGGYNDMYGYAWSAANRPRAFVYGGAPSELVLQANVSVPTFETWNGPNLPSSRMPPGFAVTLFVYLKDMLHPALHPIAILAVTHANSSTREDLGWDYCTSPSDCGVWYSSSPIRYENKSLYVTVRYTEAESQSVSASNPGAPFPFFRAHVTPQNLRNIVNAINNFNCWAALCPARGYSSDPADYVIEYAGVIAEPYIAAVSQNFDVSESQWVPNDTSKDQVKLGVHIYGVGVYRYQ